MALLQFTLILSLVLLMGCETIKKDRDAIKDIVGDAASELVEDAIDKQ